MRSTILIALATSSSLLPSLALAQAVPAADTAMEETAQLEEILVTARRREENLQEVPVAVTAFSEEALAQKGITDRTSLADNTPSLFTINGGYPREYAFFALRGQGPAFGSTPGVINYFAEVANSASPDGRVGTYYDLANVQVLAGPQGTLFGKNATGGNILFVPAKPNDTFEGYVRAQLGNYDDRRIEGAVNIPIAGDAVMLRVAGELGRRDGYTKDVGPLFAGKDYDNLHYQGARASLVLRPFDGVENYTIARIYYSNNNGGGTVLGAFNPAAGADLGPPFGFIPLLAFFPGMATAVAEQDARGPRRVAYDIDQYSRTRYWQLINQTTIELSDNINLRNIISYSQFRNRYGYDYDATANGIAGQLSRTIPTTAPNTFTEELQLQGSAFGNAVDFSLGGYLDRLTTRNPAGIEQYTFFPIGTLIPPISALFNQRNSSEALFGQATIDMGKVSPSLEGLSITGGLRYTWEHSFVGTTIVAPPAVEGSVDSNYLSYTATADYDFSDGIHGYVTARSAYKSGGVNGPVPVGSNFRTFPPEKLSDIELGLKSQFNLGGAEVRANIAAYRGIYENIQRTTNELVNGVLLNVTRSAAKGKIQGFEFNGTIAPARGLTFNASYSYIDARYTKVTDASAGAILAGSPFPYTPKHKFSFGGAYETQLGKLGELSLAANFVRQTKVSTAQTNASFYRYLPAYGLFNASVDLRNLGGKPIDLGVYVTNLFNTARPVGVIDGYNTAPGAVGLTYNEPRMFGVRLGYKFGQ